MSTQAITPRFAESLNRRLLAASELQTQAARSVALDASALGVMTVDFAAATIVLDSRGAYDLWILALLLNDLAQNIETNEHSLVRKELPFDQALRFLVLAILIELAGRIVQ
jgi:hypothetical protein